MQNGFAAAVAAGKINHLSKEVLADSVAWTAHPRFPGVFLKDVVPGADTKNVFSQHLVRVDDGCEIGRHAHDGKWELHNVVAGAGACVLGDRVIPYVPGEITVLPANVEHTVTARGADLYLLATFVPALA
ncbi:cupin domain-containing protein [Anaeroselena agilis]|uniref:Cupin domain-containing protein n=1 Tax=Anaeroselena agilis TaxID=3063788 RepID=A0ABU3P3N7_9FIRM|nr:cupin domain-containing protein [Selenomonadales bacterium 4137-cl]